MGIEECPSRNPIFPDIAPIRETLGIDLVAEALSQIASQSTARVEQIVQNMAKAGVIADGLAFLDRMRAIVDQTLLHPDDGMGPLEWVIAGLYQVAGSDHPVKSIQRIDLEEARQHWEVVRDKTEGEKQGLLESFEQRGCTIDHKQEEGSGLLIVQIPLYQRGEMVGVIELEFIEDQWTSRQSKNALDFAVVQINDRCNLLCPGCYMGKTSEMPADLRKRVISTHDIRTLLQAFPTLRYFACVGGEPLLEWKELQSTIQILRENQTTKGIFLSSNTLHMDADQARWTGDNVDSIAGKWNVGDLDDPRPLTFEYVSRLPPDVQGIIKSRHLRTRGEFYQELQGYLLTGKWGQKELSRQMLQSIETFRTNGLAGKMRRQKWRLENLLRAENLASGIVEDWLEFCLSVGAYPEPEMMAGSTATLASGSERWHENLPDTKIVEELKDIFRRVFEKHGMADRLPEHWTPPYFIQPCVMKGRTFYVSPGGELSVCPSQSSSIGNYYQDKPEGIVAHPLLLARMILQHNSQYLLSEPCGTCRAITVCRGGCRPGVEMVTRNPFSGAPNCGFYQPTEQALGRVGNALAALQTRKYRDTRAWLQP